MLYRHRAFAFAAAAALKRGRGALKELLARVLTRSATRRQARCAHRTPYTHTKTYLRQMISPLENVVVAVDAFVAVTDFAAVAVLAVGVAVVVVADAAAVSAAAVVVAAAVRLCPNVHANLRQNQRPPL